MSQQYAKNNTSMYTKKKEDMCAYQKREKLEEIITQLEYSADMLHEDNYRVAEPWRQNVPKDNND